MKKFRLTIISTLALLFLCFSCSEKHENKSRVNRLPYYEDASFTPHWINKADSLKSFHKVSDFSLLNQNGKAIDNRTFENKVYVVDFFFTTCPGICPKMQKNMGALQEEFIDDKEVMLLSHTVTPEYDSVAVLKAYAENNDVNSAKWHLVTGSRADIYHLGRHDYFIEENLGLEKSADDFLHTENFVLIDKNRHIRGIYNGLNKVSISTLIEDIKTLKQEKPLK